MCGTFTMGSEQICGTIPLGFKLWVLHRFLCIPISKGPYLSRVPLRISLRS